MADCESSRKYYHFIRLMGREASHLTVEVALQTRPTLAFVGEEVKARGLSLAHLANEIADTVVLRQIEGLEYGVVLIPEGLIDFVPEVSALIGEINEILARRDDDANAYEGITEDVIAKSLSPAAEATFEYLPSNIRSQLLLDRDPHGNVQVRRRRPPPSAQTRATPPRSAR
jgi:pyrophosphate--fructose-6-phosphate 1-phosphotransferase